ncbi:hypothetical protein [Novosphingobium sp.]|uniref:hypothetical protein n=1 Tax=Novosphingobium sp. TaxID=1874826 RepID=UPI0035B21050
MTGVGGSDSFRTDLENYRRLRFKLAECESAGTMDEALLDEVVLAEDRLMGALATHVIVVLTKFEIAMNAAPAVNREWVNTIRSDLMYLGGLDASPLAGL